MARRERHRRRADRTRRRRRRPRRHRGDVPQAPPRRDAAWDGLLGGGKEDWSTSPSLAAQAGSAASCRAWTRSRPGLSRVDRRVDACVSKTSIVRYDAYEGAGGHQSASLAFLDRPARASCGAIQGRDYARIYVKELDRGEDPDRPQPEDRGGRARDGLVALRRLLAEREDHRVLGGVVLTPRLAGDRLDRDRDRGPCREQHLADVAEGDASAARRG